MLSTYKSAAKLRLNAALECGNLQLRNLLVQSAANCVHQAYETWGYLNSRGFYPSVNLQNTAHTQLLRGFQPMPAGSVPAMEEASPHPSVPPAAFTETVFSNGFADNGPLDQGRQTAAAPAEALAESDAPTGIAAQTDGAQKSQEARKRNGRSSQAH
jgi:hypothetical protein